MKAVRKHTDNKWILLYIDRWLKAPMQMPNGEIVKREQGTPQGGVVSPVLSNLFLHYVFDVWMTQNHRNNPWCRYADDGLVHCRTEQEAKQILAELTIRFKQCHLELHPVKTKIVYCKDDQRKGTYPQTEFTFLGYTFRGRSAKNSRTNKLFIGFTPAVSREAQTSMRAEIRRRGVCRKTEKNLEDIAKIFNPILRGWLNYYGCYNSSELHPVLRHFNQTLVRWIMRKYKKFKGRKTYAGEFLQNIAKREPHLFVHWKIGIKGAFV